MDPTTRKAIIEALTQLKIAKRRIEESECLLRDLMTDLCAPIVHKPQLDMGR